jgi:excisionase family DNA binding protein
MAKTSITTIPTVSLLFRVEEAMKLLNLSRYLIYKEIHAGRLRTVKCGHATRFTRQAIDDFVARLVQEAEDAR